MVSLQPFATWRDRCYGLINPKANNKYIFILVAINCFTKCIKSYLYTHMTQKILKRFIKKELICRYELLERIITNNAQNFNGKIIFELCATQKTKHLNSSLYRPKINGAVKATNKNIKNIMQKMIITYKDWHELLSHALHTYRVAVRILTSATPYSLVYGMEVAMSLEIEFSSLKVLMKFNLEEVE